MGMRRRTAKGGKCIPCYNTFYMCIYHMAHLSTRLRTARSV